MNNLGEIQLENEIKIVDAFDLIEECSAVNLTNVQEGTWLAFNEVIEDDIDGLILTRVTDFLIIEKNYFQKNSEHISYNWETQEQPLFIEKGIIGIFNKNFTEYDEYINEMDTAISNDNRAAVLEKYVVCYTPYGSDIDCSFDVVKENDKIVAIKINFNEG